MCPLILIYVILRSCNLTRRDTSSENYSLEELHIEIDFTLMLLPRSWIFIKYIWSSNHIWKLIYYMNREKTLKSQLLQMFAYSFFPGHMTSYETVFWKKYHVIALDQSKHWIASDRGITTRTRRPYSVSNCLLLTFSLDSCSKLTLKCYWKV